MKDDAAWIKIQVTADLKRWLKEHACETDRTMNGAVVAMIKAVRTAEKSKSRERAL